MKYSIVMPVYKRLDVIDFSLKSIESQELKPFELIVVDNNIDSEESEKLNEIIKKFRKRTNIYSQIINSPKNSGSIARNIGAEFAKGDFIAFLDSDVILDENYYSVLSSYFLKNEKLIAIQGLDKSLVDYQKSLEKSKFFKKMLFLFEQFFETSFLLYKDKPYVSPSLAVAHPNVLKNFEVSSQWISTCAVVFKKEIFKKYKFPMQFITYSNNEYLFFSHKLFQDKLGLMIYTSKARYKDIQTKSGRLSQIPLMYQIESYDWFIFLKLFKFNTKNLIIFLKSRIGHMIYNLMKSFLKDRFSIKNIYHSIISIFYPLINIRSILKDDLSFYEKDFM